MFNLTRVPPRHVDGKNPPPGLDEELLVQIVTVESSQNDISYETSSPLATPKCPDVQSDSYFAKAYSMRERADVALKPWGDKKQRQTVQLTCRTKDGYSVHLQVHAPITVAVEFPETHTNYDVDVFPYFEAMEEALQLVRGTFCNSQLKKRFQMRARSNNWIPDPEDKTKPKKFPVAYVSFYNAFEYRKAIAFMRDVAVKGRDGFDFKVTVWETKDYVQPEQRFVLENDLPPGGWIRVKKSRPLRWTCSTCDIERCCRPEDITSVPEDQSVCPLCIVSFDIEVKNGTAEDRAKMKEVGLDKFPGARNPTNQVIQISVIVRTVDGRVLRFLLELDDMDAHVGDDAFEHRVFESHMYTVIYFQSERDMIAYFRDLIVSYDADILLSFNGDGFDWPYLVARMGDLAPKHPHGRFYSMGRTLSTRWETQYVPYKIVDGKEIPVVTEDPATKGKIGEERLPRRSFPIALLASMPGFKMTPELSGRISLDLLEVIRDLSNADKYLAFKNYTLDNMAERFLGDHKVSFTHNDIFDSYNGILSSQRFLEIIQDRDDVEKWLNDYGQSLSKVKEEVAEAQAAFEEENQRRSNARDQLLKELKASPRSEELKQKLDALRPLKDPNEVFSIPLGAQRRLLGDYCLKDTELPLRIMDRLGIILFLWQIARVASTAPHNVINNGSMLRGSTMFMKEAWKQGRVVNRVKNRAMAYEGATVLSPRRRYYGGGNGKDPLTAKVAVPPECDFYVPNVLLSKAIAKHIRTTMDGEHDDGDEKERRRLLQEAVQEQVDEDTLKRHHLMMEDLVDAAEDAMENLPEGWDFSGMTLRQITRYVVDYVVLTLDFKSLYPSIMLSHLFCPSTLYQPDEPETESERYARLYRQFMKRKNGVEEDMMEEDVGETTDISPREKVLENLENYQDKMMSLEEDIMILQESNPLDPELVTLKAILADASRDYERTARQLEEMEKDDRCCEDEPENEDRRQEKEKDDDGIQEDDESGLVRGLADEEDYTTICVVLTGKNGRVVGRRYHKYTKHDQGIYPVMLRELLGGRSIYKKKMELEKLLLEQLEIYHENHPVVDDEGILYESVSELAVLGYIDDLRKSFKENIKDNTRLVELTHEWVAHHSNWLNMERWRWVIETVDTDHNIYDGRQKALKVMANAIYGLSGAKQHSPCACCKLAESVTAVGRQMIAASKHCVETIFRAKYPHLEIRVIYGDTDSIFVLIKEPDDTKAWMYMNEFADYLTKVVFAGTVNVMEAECLKRRLALFKKKTYVAMENENVKTGTYKRGEKGIATVRRDKADALNKLLRVLNKAFTELGNYSLDTIATVMLRKCSDHLEKMAANQLPLEDYIIVKRINKLHTESEQTVVANKMCERTDMVPQRGDAVPYVHIFLPGEKLARRRVDSPVMIRTRPEQYRVDRSYYMRNRMEPMRSTLELFVPPETIDYLFEVYQQAVDDFHSKTIGQYVNACDDPAVWRRNEVERVLKIAIKNKRMPTVDFFPEPYGRKRRQKMAVEDAQLQERDAINRFRKYIHKGSAPNFPPKRVKTEPSLNDKSNTPTKNAAPTKSKAYTFADYMKKKAKQ